MKIGFLSDAHGNFRGFLKGFRILKDLGTDQIFFLFDSIGYFDSLEDAHCLPQNIRKPIDDVPRILGRDFDLCLKASEKFFP